MLVIRNIEIENFVCFERLELKPSADPQRPLTVIRAENGSGKTTLLRAIRWGMYGEGALPGVAHNFSLHPTFWDPDARGKTTSVSIEFETDGSSREHPQSAMHSIFNLRRSVRTVATAPGQTGAPDFQRLSEQVVLQRRQADGSWTRHDGGADAVVAELLPWELRDFFVMDADEAADYVGGSENKELDRHEVIDKTTYAVGALLGLDIFNRTRKNLKTISGEFGRAATKATGDQSLAAKQEELETCKTELDELTDRVKSLAKEKIDIGERLDRARGQLEAVVGNIQAYEDLQRRLSENRTALETVEKRRTQTLDVLGASIFDISLLASLAAREVATIREHLQPLYDDGSIPVRHLEFVRSLVERRECICGQSLDGESQFGRRVRAALDQSSEQKERADWLADVLDAANALHDQGSAQKWDDGCRSRESEFAEVNRELDQLKSIRREIDHEVNRVKHRDVQTARSEIAMLETQHERIHRDLGADEAQAEALGKKHHELVGIVQGGQARAKEAREHQADQQITDLLVDILEGAYTAIQRDQVKELDARMNRLFKRMAANVTDDEEVEDRQRKATLAMIAQVGLRPLDDDAEKYEIFALNSRGRAMPPTEINGASRRILALSFVLALCEESKTKAPLVADSLLNYMSGSVLTNTLRVTAQTASQPILLLTPSDLESEQDAEVVSQFAGATYTLTGQWQHGSAHGDVVNMTDPKKVALLCSCGPREFCSICERVGQANRTGWSRRQHLRVGGP